MKKKETITCRICQSQLQAVQPRWTKVASIAAVAVVPILGRMLVDEDGWLGAAIGIGVALLVTWLVFMNRRLVVVDADTVQSGD
jgi:hypothetical protein